MGSSFRVLLAGSPYLERRYDRIARTLSEDGIIVDRCGSQIEITRMTPLVDVLVADRHFKVDGAMMASAPRLRALISPIAGVDQFDLQAANERLLLVGRGQTPENSESMAEATILLMLACLYDLPAHQNVVRERAPRPTWPMSRLLRGKTIGLIGLGKISRGICDRLGGWGAKILVHSRYPMGEIGLHVEAATLDELLARSDIVSMHTALDNRTRGMMNATRFAQMKRGGIFINTSRAALVDEAALAAAVREGVVVKVGLDAIDPLPLPLDSPLNHIAGSILTPHMLGHTQEGAENFIATAIESVRRVRRGEPSMYVRNPEILDAWRSKWRSSD